MDKFLNLIVSGLVTGAIYSIMASGLVLTYTTSGIFNFAHGAVAFATAYLYYQLNTGLGVPDRPGADHLGVHLRPAARARSSTGSCCAGSPRRRCTPRIVGTIGLLVALPDVDAVARRHASATTCSASDLHGQRSGRPAACRCPGSARRRRTSYRPDRRRRPQHRTRSRCSSSPRSPRSCSGS